MGKTLWSSLILQATLILLLDSSNAKRNYIDIVITYVLPEIPKQFALDIINIIYNLRSNGTYISKIMSDRLKGIRYMTYGEVELRRTTCTRAESALDECPLKPKFTQIHNLEFIYIYTDFGAKTTNHAVSSCLNCPTAPSVNIRMTRRKNWAILRYPTDTISRNMISIKFNYQSV